MCLGKVVTLVMGGSAALLPGSHMGDRNTDLINKMNVMNDTSNFRKPVLPSTHDSLTGGWSLNPSLFFVAQFFRPTLWFMDRSICIDQTAHSTYD
jgi:hypothetical protein